MFELVETENNGAIIKVIGVGGGGGNTINQMVTAGIEGVEFICANTDLQALNQSNCRNSIRLGQNVTKGLGAGANPEMGRQSALESTEQIKECLQGTDMLFITAGMGGGTGTGAAPVIAQLAKELGILTVAVVTRPFPFEGKRRADIAGKGIEELEQYVDSLITIPNAKLLTNLGREITLLDAFTEANNVLQNAVQGIAELITCPGLINVDFADVKTVMTEMGMAVMGAGVAKGDDRAAQATELAMNSPLLEDIDMHGAKGILVNITSGMDLGLNEVDEVGRMIEEFASEEANVVVGTSIDMEMNDEIRVTAVFTGLGKAKKSTSAKPQLTAIDNPRAKMPPKVEKPWIATREDSIDSVIKDQNTVEKKAAAADASNRAELPEQEYLDIPAFLRDQMD